MDVSDERARGVIVLGTGGGKCWSASTPILMHDGSIKKVEDIVVGDKLMGPDSKSRIVLSLARGREKMARIVPVKGDSWVCNMSHILSLRCTANHSNKYTKDEVVNIEVRDYLKQNDKFKHMMKQYRTGIEFKKQKCDDPYLVGVWLGDGGFGGSQTTNADKEIINYLVDNYDAQVSPFSGGCHTIGLKRCREIFDKCRLNGEKRIPRDILINNRENRLKVLAGLIDTGGHLHHNFYEIITKYDGLKDDILFLSRSLGLAAYASVKEVKLEGWDEAREYWRITISGDTDTVPCLVERKKAKPRRQKKNVLNVGFKVEPLPEDDYYGFEISGDRLLMMGDFTVAHNTITAGGIIERKQVETLFVVPSLGLKKQTHRAFSNLFGADQVGMCVKENKPVIVTNVSNLVKKDTKLFSRFKMLMIDEFHHAAAKNYQTLNKKCVDSYYRYGLTGTFMRPDGNDMIMHGVLANVIYEKSASDLIEEGWLVPPTITMVKHTFKRVSSKAYQAMYDILVEDNDLNHSIQEIAHVKGIDERKQVIILVRKIEHGEYLNRIIPESVFLHGEIPMDERERVQDDFNNGKVRIVIATSVFGEGIDIPNIDVLINARYQMSEVQTSQGIGRALRTTGGRNLFDKDYVGKRSCEVYDFNLKGNKHIAKHSGERIKVYKKERAFTIKEVELTNLNSSF